MSATTIALIVAGGVAFMALMTWFSLWMVRVLGKGVLAAIRGPLEARVRARYPDAAQTIIVDYAVNSLGLESLGRWQVRGNGALVVTATELCFFLYKPEREIVIPLADVTDLSFVHSHLGKWTPHKLVKVAFRRDDAMDAIALLVPRPENLHATIAEARHRRISGLSA
jgi:hypothetical protein